jgi:4-hydroxy-tetrahydrodipicolinate reductase
MTTNVIVCGAAGRMGKNLVSLMQENPAARLVGAVEAAGHAAIGKDAGDVAGIGPIGVPLSADYDALVTADTVTLDFTIPEAAVAHLHGVAKQAAIVIGTNGFSAERGLKPKL